MNRHNLDYYRKAGRRVSGSVASGSQPPMDSLSPPPTVHTVYTREQAAADQAFLRKHSQRPRTASGGAVRDGESRMGENTVLPNERHRGGGGLTGQNQLVGAQGYSREVGSFREGPNVPESVLYQQMEMRNQQQRRNSGGQRIVGSTGIDVVPPHVGHQQQQQQQAHRTSTYPILSQQFRQRQTQTYQNQTSPVTQLSPLPQGPFPPAQAHTEQHSQPTRRILPLPSPVEPHSHVPNHSYPRSESSMLQTIMEQLNLMSARQDAAFKHLDNRVGDIENALGALDLTSVVLGKRKADTMENEGEGMPDNVNEGSKQDGDSHKQNVADMQSRMLRYLTLLAQRVGEMSRAVGGIEEALGTADSDKGFTAAQKGKNRAFASPDNIPIPTPAQNGDGSSKRASIDVDALSVDERVAPATELNSDKRSGLRGWRSTEVEQNMHRSYGLGRHSTPRYSGRSIMDRLESQEKILMDMAEWWENMKDPHADHSMESNDEMDVEEQENGLNEVQVPILSQRPSVPLVPVLAPDAGSSLHQPVARSDSVQPQAPLSRSESSSSVVDSILKRNSIDLHASDSPAVSSTSTIDAYTTTATTDSAGVVTAESPSTLSDGPVVRLHATGSEGIKLLDLAKTVISNDDKGSATGGDAAVEVRTPEIPKDSDVMGVDWPQSSVREDEPERETTKSSSSSKTLVTEPTAISTTTLQDTVDADPISNGVLTVDALPAKSAFSTPKIENKSSRAPLTIKLKLTPLRLNMATASGSKSAGAISQPDSSNTHSYSASASKSASISNATPTILPSTSTSTPNAVRSAFSFSPVVDWTSPTKASLFVTPPRAARSLRSSARRSTLPTSASPSDAYRVLRTPTKSNNDLGIAERGMQGLLDAQLQTPKRTYSLNSSGILDLDSAGKRKSLTIRIPGSASQSRTPSHTGMSPTIFKQEDTSSKKTAEHALEGLLDAQAMAPDKSFGISSDIVPEIEVEKLSQKPSATKESTPSPRKSATLPLNSPQVSKESTLIYDKTYALPPPPEGTVAALCQQALGHPFMHVDIGLRSPAKEMETSGVEQEGSSSISLTPEGLEPEDEEMTDASKQGEAKDHAHDDSMKADDVVGDISLPLSDSLEIITPVSPIDAESAPIVRSPVDPDHERESSPTSVHSFQMPDDTATLTSGPESQTQHSLSTITSWPPLTPQAADSIQSASFAEFDGAQPPSSSVHTFEPPSPGIPTNHGTPRIEITPLTDQVDVSSVQRDQPPALLQTIKDISGASLVAEAHEAMDLARLSLSTSTEFLAQSFRMDEIPASQASSTTEDEENVHSLVLDNAGSSPSPHKAIVRQAHLGNALRDMDDTQGTPSRPHSAPRQSSEVVDIVHHEMAETLMKKEDDAPFGMTKTRTYISSSPLFTSPSIHAQDEGHSLAGSEETRMNNNRVLSISPSLPQSQVDEPELSAEDILLLPENLLHVKQELDNSFNSIIQPQRNTITTPKTKAPSSSQTAKLTHIYVSDSERTPQKLSTQKLSTRITRSAKKAQKKRAPSVIYISSDDDKPPPTKPAPSKIVEALKIEQSAPVNGEIDNASHQPMHSVRDIETFDDALSTSTPLRSPNRQNTQPPAVAQDDATNIVPAAPITSEPPPLDDMFTKELSPISDLSQSPSPVEPAPDNNDGGRAGTIPIESPAANPDGSSFNLEKYIARLVSDDDMPTLSKKNRKASGMSVAPSEFDSAHATDKNTPAEPVVPPKKSLLNIQKKGKSAAVTRVKKRKGRPAEMDSDEDLRPLKKANLRKSKEAKVKVKQLDLKGKESPNVHDSKGKLRQRSERSPAKKVKAELLKTPTRLPRGKQQPRTVKWPTIEKPNYDQFIQCDSCTAWYHWGCVGIGPNDIRLEDSEIYTCPPCEAGVSSRDLESPEKHTEKFDDPQSNACNRPKCKRPKKVKTEVTPVEETFVVESFIGRHRKMVGGKGLCISYLVKWHGYPHDQCTWEALDGMGLADPSMLIHTFEKAAAEEDIDLENLDDEHLLLEEARSTGWQPDGGYIPP